MLLFSDPLFDQAVEKLLNFYIYPPGREELLQKLGVSDTALNVKLSNMSKNELKDGLYLWRDRSGSQGTVQELIKTLYQMRHTKAGGKLNTHRDSMLFIY